MGVTLIPAGVQAHASQPQQPQLAATTSVRAVRLLPRALQIAARAVARAALVLPTSTTPTRVCQAPVTGRIVRADVCGAAVARPVVRRAHRPHHAATMFATAARPPVRVRQIAVACLRHAHQRRQMATPHPTLAVTPPVQADAHGTVKDVRMAATRHRRPLATATACVMGAKQHHPVQPIAPLPLPPVPAMGIIAVRGVTVATTPPVRLDAPGIVQDAHQAVSRISAATIRLTCPAPRSAISPPVRADARGAPMHVRPVATRRRQRQAVSSAASGAFSTR